MRIDKNRRERNGRDYKRERRQEKEEEWKGFQIIIYIKYNTTDKHSIQ